MSNCEHEYVASTIVVKAMSKSAAEQMIEAKFNRKFDEDNWLTFMGQAEGMKVRRRDGEFTELTEGEVILL